MRFHEVGLQETLRDFLLFLPFQCYGEALL
jgi:hypothetical protein